MKNILGIISDFDGTIIDHDFNLSNKLINSIKSYIKLGNVFSIATGRAYHGVTKNFLKQIGAKTLVIVRGGSEIRDPQTGEIAWAQMIDENSAREIISMLLKRKIQFAAEQDEFVYTHNGQPRAAFGKDTVYKDLNEIDYRRIPKIVLYGELSEEEWEATHNAILAKYNVHIAKFKNWSTLKLGMDINAAGVSKHRALLELARIIKIDPTNLAGIGDSYNDYPLLSACGLKVAMGNAPKELTDIADLVVADVHNDGVVELIEKLIEGSPKTHPSNGSLEI